MAEDGCIKSGIFQTLEVVDKINLSGPEIVGDTLIGTPYDGNSDFEPDILYLNSIIKAPIVSEQVRNTYYDVAPTKNTKVLVRQTDNTLKYEPKAESVFKTINVLNQDNIIADNLTDTFTLIPGTNMTIETDNTTNSIKFSSSSGSNVQNIFKTIRVEGHADLIPDTSIDVLKFNQTDNITITPTTTTSVTNTYQSIIRYNNNLYDDNNLINDSLTLYYTDDIGNTTNDVAVVFSLVSGDPNTPTNTAVEFKKETDVDTTATNLSDAINNHNSFSSNIDTANNIIYVTQLSSRNPVDTETTFTGALVELAVGERNFSAISQEISTLDISLNNKINNDLIIGEDNKDLLLVNSESIFENNSTFNSNINVNESLNVDNIKLDGNTISSTDTNGNINITPDGNGDVVISKVQINSGDINGVTIGTTDACTDLRVDNIKIDGNTISSTDANGNINIIPDGEGTVNISKTDISEGIIHDININVGTNKVFNALGSTLIFDNDQISGDAINEGTIDSIAISQLTGDMDCNSQVMTNINIDSGEIDNVTIGTNNPCTELHVDNVKIDENTISSTDNNGNINIIPDGDGIVNISKTNISEGIINNANINDSNITIGTNKVFNVLGSTLIFDNDQISGDAINEGTIDSIAISQLTGEMDCNSQAMTNINIDSGVIDNVTIGTNSPCTELRVDNLKIDGNTISSTDSNGNINIEPDGDGIIDLKKNIKVGTTLLNTDINNGRIGIGTTNPTEKLDVNGNIKVDLLKFNNEASNFHKVSYIHEGTLKFIQADNQNRVLTSQSGNLEWVSYGTVATGGIDTNDLGILNTPLDADLYIGKDKNNLFISNGQSTFYENVNIINSKLRISSSTGANLVFETSTTNNPVIRSTNNKITFESTDTNETSLIISNLYNNNGTDNYVGDCTIGFLMNGSSNQYTLGVDDSDDKFKIGTSSINTNTRLTIDSSGNVGIGTTTPTRKLDVIGDIRSGGSHYMLWNTTIGGTGSLNGGSSYGRALVHSQVDSSEATEGNSLLVINYGGDFGSGTRIDGNLGIGINPTSKLHVNGTTNITGVTNINDTTQSDSTATGALIVDGGVGIAENTHIGGVLNVGNNFRLENNGSRLKIGGGQIYGDGNSGLTFYTGNQNNNSSLVLNNDKSARFNGDVTIESPGTVDTTLTIKADDSRTASLNLYGETSQGTGRVYVGQDINYGGGFLYSGDSTPSTIYSDDTITFFRRDNGTESKVFQYSYGSDHVNFFGNVHLESDKTIQVGTADTTTNLEINPGSNNGNARIGRAFIGYGGNGVNQDAGFGHITYIGNTSSCALKQTNTGATVLSSASEQDLFFRIAGSDKMRISGAPATLGNVGIGTTIPSSKLHIYNSAVSNKVVENNVDLLIEDAEARLQIISTDSGAAGSLIALSNVLATPITTPSLTIHQKNWVFHHSGPSQDNKLGIYYRENGENPNDNNIITDSLYNISTTGLTLDTSGNVGIGTTSPSSKLHIRSDTTGQNSLLILENNTTTWGGNNDGASIEFKTYETGNQTSRSQAKILIADPTTNSSDDADLVFQTRGIGSVTEKMRISNSGNVGIGTTNPAEKLHVNGHIRVGSSLYVDGNTYYGSSTRQMINLYNNDYGIGVQSATTYFRTGNDFQFYKGGIHHNDEGNAGLNGTTLLTIKRTGYVGIGTNPDAPLHIYSATSGNSLAIDNTNTGNSGRTSILFRPDGNNWELGARNSNSGDLTNKFYLYDINSSATRLLVESSTGNVGIGTINPSQKLEVNGNIKSSGTEYMLWNSGRGGVGSSLGRVLVHQRVDSSQATQGNSLLVINYNGDFGSGTRIDGNVGIGTTPSSGLHIYRNTGSYRQHLILENGQDNDNNVYMILFKTPQTSSGSQADQCGIGVITNANSRQIWSDSRYSMTHHIENTSEWVIKTSGWINLFGIKPNDRVYIKDKLGIGTTDPDEKLEVNGNILADNVFSNNTKNNLMDTDIWRTQSSGTITDSIGKYTLNQTTSGENSMRVNDIGPFGDYDYVWEATSLDTITNADGGWNYYIYNVNSKFGYMSVVYFKVVNNSGGSFYHGCHECLELDGTAQDNPYFVSGTNINNYTLNEWYVSVGVILPYQSGGYSSPSTIGGIYHLSTGQKVRTHTNFMMKENSTTQRHRAYLYYSTIIGSKIYFTRPGFYKINGTELTLTELLGGNVIPELTSSEINLSPNKKIIADSIDISNTTYPNTSITSNIVLLEIFANTTSTTISRLYAGSIDIEILGKRSVSYYSENILTTKLHFSLSWNATNQTFSNNKFILENKTVSDGTYDTYTLLQGIPEFKYKYDNSTKKYHIYVAITHKQSYINISYSSNVSSVNVEDIYIPSSNTLMSTGTSYDIEPSICYDNDGNLGIGTTSPSTKLHISGEAEILRLQGSTHSYISFYPVNNTTRYGYIGYTSGGTEDLSIWNQRDGNLKFSTDNTEKMIIKSDGNVGIGTTNPTCKLHINQNTANFDIFRITGYNGRDALKITTPGTSTNSATIFNTINAYSFNVDQSSALYIKHDGLVGIGTTGPTERLDVNGQARIRSNMEVDGNVDLNSSSSNNRQFIGYGTIPIGGIIMWNNYNNETVPDGWALCNGDTVNGILTPDLRGRFVMSSTYGDFNVAGEGTANYSVGNSGGEQQVTLTTAEIPSHSHSYIDRWTLGDNEGEDEGHRNWAAANWFRERGAVTNPAGGGGSHENRPPYYVLAYIMRIR